MQYKSEFGCLLQAHIWDEGEDCKMKARMERYLSPFPYTTGNEIFMFRL